MNWQTLLFFIIQSTLVTPKLYFKFQGSRDGSTQPHLKHKGVREMVCEDSFHTTPYGFALADGVGGVPFPTTYFAESLTRSVAASLMDIRDSEFILKTHFNSFIHRQVIQATDEYNKNLTAARVKTLEEISEKTNQKVSFEFKNFIAAATFVAAHIEDSKDDGPVLNIFQKGDSGLVVFRPKKHSAAVDAYHYYPVYVTQEQTIRFNQPYQFSNMNEPIIRNSSEKIKIAKGDIVIAGSDGLFDNMSLGFLTYVLNYLLSEMLIDELTTENGLIKMKSLVLKFIEKQQMELNRIKKFTKSLTTEDKDPREGFFVSLGKLLSGVCTGGREEEEPAVDYLSERAHTASVPNPAADSLDSKNNVQKSITLNKISEFDRENFSFIEHMRLHREAFFQCHSDEILWENYKEDDRIVSLVSHCVSEAISHIFLFNAEQINQIEQKLSPTILTDSISNAAKALSLSKMSNFTPFYFKMVVATGRTSQEGGKPDDITAVAGLVVDEAPTSEAIEQINAELKTSAEKTNANLAEDVNHYIEKKLSAFIILATLPTEQNKSESKNIVI